MRRCGVLLLAGALELTLTLTLALTPGCTRQHAAPAAPTAPGAAGPAIPASPTPTDL